MKYLSPEAQALCQEIVAACRETGEHIQACVACGLDVQEEQATNEDQLKIAQALLANFTPKDVVIGERQLA